MNGHVMVMDGHVMVMWWSWMVIDGHVMVMDVQIMLMEMRQWSWDGRVLQWSDDQVNSSKVTKKLPTFALASVSCSETILNFLSVTAYKKKLHTITNSRDPWSHYATTTTPLTMNMTVQQLPYPSP